MWYCGSLKFDFDPGETVKPISIQLFTSLIQSNLELILTFACVLLVLFDFELHRFRGLLLFFLKTPVVKKKTP